MIKQHSGKPEPSAKDGHEELPQRMAESPLRQYWVILGKESFKRKTQVYGRSLKSTVPTIALCGEWMLSG